LAASDVRIGRAQKGIFWAIPDRQKLYTEIPKNTIVCRARIASRQKRWRWVSDLMASEAMIAKALGEKFVLQRQAWRRNPAVGARPVRAQAGGELPVRCPRWRGGTGRSILSEL
jgi:hypothetical protein